MSATAGRLLAFFEELREEGVAVGTSEIMDAFSALDEVSWADQRDFREALAATVAKSQEIAASSSCSSTGISFAPPKPRR